jgi:hypothetical protein
MESNKVLKKYAEEVQSEQIPPPRFGHSVNIISKTRIVIFGGAISTPNSQASYTMTSDLYLYNMAQNTWKKLEPSNSYKPPHVRAAHASATVRDNQVLYYGGSIGNGQYAKDDLWFLDIKNQEEVSWMQVPIEGATPGPRYGHSMVYIFPNLILFGGSSNSGPNRKNVILKDVWLFPTDKTPFNWIKVETESSSLLTARLYHTCCVYQKINGEGDDLVLFGGRDAQNVSLKDLSLLEKQKDNFYKWKYISPKNNDPAPISRHQHSATMFGPFLFVIGGRSSHTPITTFDVFSFISYSWYRFGNVGIFRHTIWIYFNDYKDNDYELFLYIYGGFDSEHNPEINSKLFKINIIDLFNQNPVLKEELNSYLAYLAKRNNAANSNKAKTHFELSHKVVVYNIPEEDNFGKIVKQISYSKLTEVDKKITDTEHISEMDTKPKYNESLINDFLQLLPNPDEEYTYYKKNANIILLDKNYISNLITEALNQLKASSPLIKLRSPVKIFGSINGQYNDLMRYFSLFGRPSELKGDIESCDYLFLGNFTNRGAFSLETICLLLALKIKYNGHFHLLRGNQEDIEISKLYGLADECKEKLKEDINQPNSIFQQLCNLFEYLPLAAVINNQIFCAHSGISKNGLYLKEIQRLTFPIKIKSCQIAKDLLWNTPNIYENTNFNKLFPIEYKPEQFNANSLDTLFNNNKLKLMIRSHDVCQKGIGNCFGDRLITIFSSTNYCGVYQNAGAIIFIKKSYEIQPKILTCEENIAVWQNDWSKTNYPPSPLRNFQK